MSRLPFVAIVGRPNVGKSTLFNRLLGRREAVADSMPGVTRDRNEEICTWRGRRFVLVDTGGWMTGDKSALEEQVVRQAEAAVRTADVVLFVVDASSGILPEDREIAQILREHMGSRGKGVTPSEGVAEAASTGGTGGGPAIVVVANKADSAVREAVSQEAYALGLGEVYPVSALHGLAVGELLDKVVDELGEAAPFEEPEDLEEAAAVPEVAIVGRPNVGKSTLFNALVAEERAIVSEVPGTTRDAIDTIVETPDGRKYRFVDTAGLRKERKYRDTVEFYSATRTFRAIDRADVAILVLDATEGVTRQDQAIAERILAGGSGVVVALNKWDAIDAEQREAARLGVKERLRFLHFAPVLEISALTGKGLGRILPIVDTVLEAYEWRVGTGQLNAVLEEIVSQHPPPVDRRRGKRPKTLYATQAARRPPTFVFFTSAPLPDQYLRYLENQLRARLGIGPTPVKMKVVARRRAGRR